MHSVSISLVVIVLASLLVALPSGQTGTRQADASDTLRPPEVTSVYVRAPRSALTGVPSRILLALHGMGDSGERFTADLKVAADQHGWVLVAPTIAYGDWTNPTQVAHEDATLIDWLATYLQQLPEQTGLQIDPGVLVLGFSRGAQLAHRFAEAYPRRVRDVAALAAGTYTLPEARAADGTALSFPFGVGDLPASVGRPFRPEQLRSVRFWVGVGGVETNPADVPRQWDYEGDNRLDRAQAFVAALAAIDVSARLTVFPDVPHDLTPIMQQAAITFLGS